MSQDLYKEFAERYDLFHGEFGAYETAEVGFYRHLFAAHRVQSVLDCACGTGRHLPLFDSLGCEVVGSDLSDAMLAEARKNLNGHGLDVPLHKADYRELPQHFRRQFDAVTCLSSSILHMPTEADVVDAFTSMHAVLRQGGILVLTQGTTDKQWQEKPRFIPVVQEREFTRLFVIDYVDRGAKINVMDIYHSDELRSFEVWSVFYNTIYLRDDYERLLRASGFGVIGFYGSYGFEPYDKHSSNRLIAVARR